jgi:hypothetical protein
MTEDLNPNTPRPGSTLELIEPNYHSTGIVIAADNSSVYADFGGEVFGRVPLDPDGNMPPTFHVTRSDGPPHALPPAEHEVIDLGNPDVRPYSVTQSRLLNGSTCLVYRDLNTLEVLGFARPRGSLLTGWSVDGHNVVHEGTLLDIGDTLANNSSEV